MSIIAEFDARSGILKSRASGTISYLDLLEHLRVARQLSPGAPELFDATGAVTDLTPAQVGSLAQEATELFDRGELGPTAVIASDYFLFGMARMYEGITADHAGPFHVFRELAPAKEWIGAQTAAHSRPRALA